MSSFHLHFSGGSRPELIQTSFEHPLVQCTLTSIRGKSEGAYSRRGTFQWTPAVRALSVLLLRTKLASAGSHPVQFTALQAIAPGAISALDYAIGRHAAWISDMFGVDREGHPVARRIFKRSNPERKRPGPVAIALNQKFLAISHIEFFVAGKALTQHELLNNLVKNIVDQGELALGITYGFQSEVESTPNTLVDLKPAFLQEVRRMLRATDIFSKRALREALNEIEATPALQKVESEILSAFEEIDLKFAGCARLGLTLKHEDLAKLFPADHPPLRIGVTPSQVGTLALLRYLRDVRKLPIEIDYSFAHTSDLARGIEAGGHKNFPDCCVMTTASFALLNRKMRREYRPLMVMPAATHSIMGPRTDSPQTALAKSANYLLLCDFPTTPLFWFEALQKSGVIAPVRARSTHLDPDETLTALRTNDPELRAILWFPYNVIAENLSQAVPFLHSPSKGAGLGYIQNLLFVHESFMQDRKGYLLDILFRDAWLTLMENEQLCSDLVRSQLEESEYQRNLWRYSGLYRIEDGIAA